MAGVPDWQVFPTNAWNYALQLDTDSLAESIAVEESKMEEGPFTRQHAPVRLKVKARQVVGWRAEDGAANPLPPSPVASEEPEKTITLIPYAAAKLRITAFPQSKTQGRSARTWRMARRAVANGNQPASAQGATAWQPPLTPFAKDGAPREIRTPGLLVRSQTLYPTELGAHKRDVLAV